MFRNNDDLLQQAYSQTSFFGAGWSPFFWSFVPKVMQISSPNQSKKWDDRSNVWGKRWQDVKVFFPPPVIGVVVGLAIAMSPLSPLLVGQNNPQQQNQARLAIVYNSFQNLGKTASPLAVLVLTCSLAFGARGTTTINKITSPNDRTRRMHPLRKWACVSFTRLIVSPLVMFGLLHGMARIGLIGSQHAEPMAWFVCLLESIMPPAQNSVVLLQVAGRSNEAGQMAQFLFSVYATAMIPIVVLVTILLQSLGITP
jgi:predicted permease